jgi:prepilin-type processing-associated H-X9-DG protein
MAHAFLRVRLVPSGRDAGLVAAIAGRPLGIGELNEMRASPAGRVFATLHGAAFRQADGESRRGSGCADVACPPKQRHAMKATRLGERKHQSGALPAHKPNDEHAFTRVELVIVLLVLAGLVCVVLPAFGASAARSRLAHCFNNLRQVGSGFQNWSLDANDKLPWLVTTAQGGSFDHILKANAWSHFAVVSNYFPNPSVLVCPSDAVKRTASHFGNFQPGGFAALGNRDLTLSYIAGLHAENGWPREILSGDRNIRTSGTINCGKIGVGTAQGLLRADSSVAWTNFHNATGNLLFTDGSVRTLSSAGLRQAVDEARQEAQTHILIPELPNSVPE